MALSTCSVDGLGKFAGEKSKNEALAGRSTFMFVLNLDPSVSAVPALNSEYAPSAKPLTIDDSIKYPPTHVPDSVNSGFPPNLPVPVSKPCL